MDVEFSVEPCFLLFSLGVFGDHYFGFAADGFIDTFFQVQRADKIYQMATFALYHLAGRSNDS